MDVDFTHFTEISSGGVKAYPLEAVHGLALGKLLLLIDYNIWIGTLKTHCFCFNYC